MNSFSLILETENLETADFQGLRKSLDSLALQKPDRANEVILIDSGDLPEDFRQQIQFDYPWLQFKIAPADCEYYASKMLGLEWTTGEILVYYDSDCIYDRNWLTTILNSFENPDIQIVCGETTTDGVGFYGTAMALCYIFPQYSGRTELFPVKQYFLNNVAFRRSVLQTIPIPTDLPLYRGNCVLHAKTLVESGYTIWRQPEARSLHAPPNGFKHYFQRFLLIGHDWYWQQRLVRSPLAPLNKGGTGEVSQNIIPETQNHLLVPLNKGDLGGSGLSGLDDSQDPTITTQSKLAIGLDRISKMIQRDRRHAFYLPLCLPIVLFSVLLITIGYQITVRRPYYLRDRMG